MPFSWGALIWSREQTGAHGFVSFDERLRAAAEHGAKRAAELAAFLQDEIVEDVGHAQWVFTIPKMLRGLLPAPPGASGRALAGRLRKP